MTTRQLLEHVFTGAAVLAAVTVAALAVRREFRHPVPRPRTALSDTLRVSSWEAYARSGHRFGSAVPKVTIVEFTDFQCPYCREFYLSALRPIMRRYPEDVALVVQHYPLTMHRFAYPAARAAECAADQGRFAEFHDLLFAKQDSLGLAQFGDLAKQSGVPDLAAFGRCNILTSRVPVIDSGLAWAKRLDGNGTPLVLINGLRFTGSIDSLQLDRLVRDALAKP